MAVLERLRASSALCSNLTAMRMKTEPTIQEHYLAEIERCKMLTKK